MPFAEVSILEEIPEGDDNFELKKAERLDIGLAAATGVNDL